MDVGIIENGIEENEVSENEVSENGPNEKESCRLQRTVGRSSSW